MKRLLNALHRAWLRHDIRSLAAEIDYAQVEHAQHGARMDHWLREIARKKGELAALDRGPIRVAPIAQGHSLHREQPAIVRLAQSRRSR